MNDPTHPSDNIVFSVRYADILQECNGEKDLVSYMLKIHMRELQIPIVIDPLSIRSNTLEVMHGRLTSYTYPPTGTTSYIWTPNES